MPKHRIVPRGATTPPAQVEHTLVVTTATNDATRLTDVSLSLVVHQPVEDNARRVRCPQCATSYLANCGPRLFYCTTCHAAVVFQRGPDALEAVVARALVTAARSVIDERSSLIEQIDKRDLHILALEQELRALKGQFALPDAVERCEP